MQNIAATTVGDLVRTLPGASDVFDVVQITTCCRRDRTLADACKAAGIDAGEVLALLNGVPIGSQMPAPLFAADTPLTEITKRISDDYHRRARSFLVTLTRAVRALCGGHGEAAPELWQLRTVIGELAHELVPHMYREERYLFPYINAFDGGRMERDIVVPLFGTVEYPLQFVRHDHNHDVEAIKKIREVTKDFTPSVDSCPEFRTLYSTLRDFTSELQDHIDLENEILFPRAVQAEKTIFERSKRVQ